MQTAAVVILSIVGVVLIVLAVTLPIVFSSESIEPEDCELNDTSLSKPHGCFVLASANVENGFYKVGAKKNGTAGNCMSHYATAKSKWDEGGEASECGQAFLRGMPMAGYGTTRDGSGVPEMAFYDVADPTQCEMNTVYNNSGNAHFWNPSSMPVGTQMGVAESCDDALALV